MLALTLSSWRHRTDTVQRTGLAMGNPLAAGPGKLGNTVRNGVLVCIRQLEVSFMGTLRRNPALNRSKIMLFILAEVTTSLRIGLMSDTFSAAHLARLRLYEKDHDAVIGCGDYLAKAQDSDGY